MGFLITSVLVLWERVARYRETRGEATSPLVSLWQGFQVYAIAEYLSRWRLRILSAR